MNESLDWRSRQTITLGQARSGQNVALVRVEDRHLGHRLAEMGLVPGARFQIMAKGRPGPVIIGFGNSRMVLGRGMVHRIFVRSLEARP